VTTLLDHVATAFAEIPPGSRLPAYSLEDLCRFLRRGLLPIDPKRLAGVLGELGWRRHRVWRLDTLGRKRLVSLWITPDAAVTKRGIHWRQR
jgi:hypothetical protein